MSLKVTTFSSKGRATRIYSYKTNKIHHLQSDNQLRVFLSLEWDDKVKNIKENVMLDDLEATLYNVENLRLDKFRDKETGELYDLHTNFLIKKTTKDKAEETIALSVKSISELQRVTVIEKMEIERRYWEIKGIKFYVITDNEINKQFVENIKWVRETLIDKSIRNRGELAENLYYFLQERNTEKLSEVLEEFDIEEGLIGGTALFIFRYLIGIKEIEIDMTKSINLNEVVSFLIKF